MVESSQFGGNMVESSPLRESLKTLRNIIDALVILENLGQGRLIPTQIEFLYLEAEKLIEDFCIVRERIE